MQKTILLLGVSWCLHFQGITQPLRDTSTVPPATQASSVFQRFAGSINTLFNGNQAFGSFDLSVQSYHYFLVTGRQYHNDSIHKSLIQKKRPFREIYKGIHFFVLNRAAIDFDTLRAIANNYISSLQASPLTFRLRREFFITKEHEINNKNYSPVISFLLSGDARAIPFGDQNRKVQVGASGHLFMTFSAMFKRIEFSNTGKEIDKGTMYLRPTFGIAYGSHDLMKSVLPRENKLPVMTSGCRVGFTSEQNRMKDFSFIMQYTLSEIIGPKLRAGIILSSL